jgi:acyl-CoA thioesterase FadM
VDMGQKHIPKELRKEQVSLRLHFWMIEVLKEEADNEGIGYTTFMEQIIGDYLHEKGFSYQQLPIIRACRKTFNDPIMVIRNL